MEGVQLCGALTPFLCAGKRCGFPHGGSIASACGASGSGKSFKKERDVREATRKSRHVVVGLKSTW